ncbi:SIR2 family protein [Rhodococcus sp. ARC_M6]|uniref:SIR2 family protein n=1 Tax=Rhodococcus sp. ARC_M6 TaxID=2928852 RepID=UPI001FB1AD59|nr:SIR2 family protein [Rhodococcus sp. ARC_M6]MCJ0906477.1 SIR2 family protein [Rhodococcus sp. ARC_M6]
MAENDASAGHVFVVRGRLESVDWDAAVVSTSGSFVPRDHWWPVLGITGPVDQAPPGAGRIRSFPKDGRPVWLLNVASRISVSWLVDGVHDVLDAIAATGIEPGGRRIKPLIALPTFGVGLGGQGMVRGQVIKALVEAATSCAAKYDFDIVFVVANNSDYAAYQSVRRVHLRNVGVPLHVQELADKLQAGDVSLLLGAGVSIPAGLPTWDGLLETIRSDVLPEMSTEDFALLGVLDRAQLLSKSMEPDQLGERVAELTGDRDVKPTLAHCLLSSLAVSKVVTTNYDSLYEKAFESAHGAGSIAVLPRGEVTADRPWILKLHGDISDPSSIVLSRRDFVRYDAERRPLGSIVQSLMATGHLIVVGASMTDDNVLRLAHEVLALNERHSRQRSLGTVITLRNDTLRTALWRGDFDYVAASKAEDDATAARDLEILLDSVSILTSVDAPYLLDTNYRGLLDGDEVKLADALRDASKIIGKLPSESRDRWRTLESALIELGAKP